MKKLLIAVAILLVASEAYAGGSHYTHSYVRKDGTYVQGHYSGNPDHTVNNNQSLYGNSNINNGSTGSDYYKHDTTSPYFDGTPDNSGRYGHRNYSR